MARRTEGSEQHLTDRLRQWGIVSWSLIGILFLAAGAVWALMQVTDVFPPLVLALVTIYLLNPIVSRFERVGVGRVTGSCLAYTVFFAVVALALSFLIPSLVDQGQALVRDFPDTVERIADLADRATVEIRDRFGTSLDVGEWLGGRTDLLSEGLGRIGTFLRGAVHTLALLAIGLVLGFYMLIDLPRLKRAGLRLIPPHRRAETTDVASAVGRAMGGFFRGQLLVALIVGILSSLALRLLGLPYWLVIGLIAGFFNLIPLIGPFVGAIPAVLVAGAVKPPITMLWVALALTAVQQIDNHFISPNVMRWTVRLHPVTVMLSLIVGATLAGFWGMLMAVPVVASGKVIVSHFWRTRVPWGHEVFEEGDPMEAIPPEQASPTEMPPSPEEPDDASTEVLGPFAPPVPGEPSTPSER